MQRQDIGPGAQAALQQLAEARRDSRDALRFARGHEVPTNTATFGDSALRGPHASVFSFYDAVRPYRVGARDLWQSAEICEFHVPRTPEHVQRVVINGLLELDGWRNCELNHQYEQESAGDTQATDTKTRTDRIWLPLNALQDIHDSLEDTLVVANLAAKLPEREEGGEPA
jgi:hypothetical protein